MRALILLIAFALPQDAEKNYRQALFEEVDRGNLDKAVELYKSVTGSSKASKSLRARATFRLAWCLEKQGNTIEAERTYREVTTSYAGVDGIDDKARDRLNKLITGNGTAPRASMDDRIASLILKLGSTKVVSGRTYEGQLTVRELVLIGNDAIPSLKRALAHKDTMLSAMAACALVELEQDTGTFSALIRGTTELDRVLRQFCREHLVTLIQRQKSLRKDFADRFRSTKDAESISHLYEVIEEISFPELSDHYQKLIVSGPPNLVHEATKALGVKEDQLLFSILDRLDSGEQATKRALTFLMFTDHSVRDGEGFGKRIRKLFSAPNPKEISTIFKVLGERSSSNVALRSCGPGWLTSDEPVNIESTLKFLVTIGPSGTDILLDTMEKNEKLALNYRTLYWLTSRLKQEKRADIVERSRKLFWGLYDKMDVDSKSHVVTSLLHHTPPGHGDFDRIVRNMVTLEHSEDEGTWRAVDKSVFMEMFQKQGKRGRDNIRKVVNEIVTSGNAQERKAGVGLIGGVGDSSRFEALGKLALDAKQTVDLRRSAISAMREAEEVDQVQAHLAKLTRDADAGIRSAAVTVLKRFHDEETRKILEPLIEDKSAAIRNDVVHYFTRRNAGELRPLVRALKCREADLRSDAVKALSDSGNIEAVPHLIRMLEDPDADVRMFARKGLEQIRKHHDEIKKWKKWYKETTGKDSEDK